MAKGEIKYTLSADGTPMRQELSKSESDLKRFQGMVGRVTREIEGGGAKASKEIGAFAAALKKMGGEANLSEPQLRAVAQRLTELEAKGGKIPPHLRAIADRFKEASGGAANLSKEIAAIKDEKLTELAGKAGLAGRGMAALGPAGIAAAAALALTVGAAGAVAATLTSATKEAVAYSDRITNISSATDIGTEALQKFEHVARLSGGSVEGMATASNKLKNSLANAPERFEQLGLSVDRLLSLSPEQQLQEVATALQAMENPTLRDAAAMEILGAKSSAVFGILKSNIPDIAAAAERLGLVLSKDTVAALDDLGDSASTLGATWDALWRQLGAAIGSAPALKGIFDDMAQLVGSMAAAVRDAAPGIRALAEGAFGTLRDALYEVLTPLRELVGLVSDLGGSGLGKLVGFFGKAALNMATYGIPQGLAAAGKARRDRSFLYGETHEGTAIDPARHWQLMGNGPKKPGETDWGTMAFSDIGRGSEERNAERDKVAAEAKAAAEKARRAMEQRFAAEDAFYKAAEDNARETYLAALAYRQWGQRIRDEQSAIMTDRLAPGGVEAARKQILESNFFGYTPDLIKSLGLDVLSTPTDSRGKPKQFNLGFSSVTGSGVATAPDPIVRSSFDASQALQNLANIASISGSKLGKGLASILGGGAGLAGGIGSLFGRNKTDFGSNPITSFLGKAGMWGQIGASVLSIGSSLFGLFKKKPKEPPAPPPPPKERVDVDAGALSGNLGTAFKGATATTGADAAAQAKILSVSFWQVFTEQGLVAAATSFRDVFMSLRDRLGELGGDAVAEAILGPIGSLMDKMDNEQFKGAAESAHAYAQILKELGTKEVPLTIDQFQAFEQQLGAVKAQAEAGGATTKESFAVIAPFLQEVIQRANQYGFTLDENTQKLIDQAKAAGVAFPTDPIDRLIAKMDEFFNKLLGIDGRTVNVGVNTHFTRTGETGGLPTGGSGAEIPGFARGSGGVIDFGDETITALHGREAILTERQYDALLRPQRSDTGARSSAQGSREPIVVQANLTTYLDGKVVAKSMARVMADEGPEAKEFRTKLNGRRGE